MVHKSLFVEGVRDYSPVANIAPVREETITQLEPGEFRTSCLAFRHGNVCLVHVSIDTVSVGRTLLEPGNLAFVFPDEWATEYLVNGRSAHSFSFHLLDDDSMMFVRGGRRSTAAMVLQRDDLVATLSALRGSDRTAVLRPGPHQLPPAECRELRRNIITLLRHSLAAESSARWQDDASRTANVDQKAYGLLLETLLRAEPVDAKHAPLLGRAAAIVRAAEEHFAMNLEGKVSLADLCDATGVSKSVLYRAFDLVCGEPPLAYFHKRRLSRARAVLLRGTPFRGKVMQAALSSGLTELGRFSVEYRQLFGESPRVTLRSQPEQVGSA